MEWTQALVIIFTILAVFFGCFVYLASKIDSIGTKLDTKIDTKTAELRKEFKEEMIELRKEFKEDMTELRKEFKEEMAELRKDLDQRFFSLQQYILFGKIEKTFFNAYNSEKEYKKEK